MSLHVYIDPDALAKGVASVLIQSIRTALEQRGICHFVVAGGNTPRKVYALLASEGEGQIDWSKVNLYWGDERFVSRDDPASNYRMVKESLLDPTSIPSVNVFPMPVDRSSQVVAAQQYEQQLRSQFPDGEVRFDIVLLGMGGDGHTASLFPGTPAAQETQRWVAVATAPVAPRQRLTLTFPALNQAREVHFLVAGGGKAEALKGVLEGQDLRYPAVLVKPIAGTVDWWVDEAAAAML